MNCGKKLFLSQEFPTPSDVAPINNTMRNANTMDIPIVHIYLKTERIRISDSDVFKLPFEPPFGSFISYVATNSEMKDVDLGQQFASKLLNGQIQCHGIGRKLMNLVQYISWLIVRNISIYLVATEISTEYYDKLDFSSYPSDNE